MGPCWIGSFPRHCVPFPNLLPTLTQIKAAGVKLGLISNGFGDFQFANLQALCIDHLFDEILISEWEELRKPDPACRRNEGHLETKRAV
ncbi:HAD family hydrolase [Brevibacillus centrosporus]|uniref:HAD family hydrolase n=1 Tax=Brevibacillus centrosporus TaxID=54910 RepID=UPI003D23D1C7